MRYFCIYEINNNTKETSFVENFYDEVNDAQDFCLAMNNFAPAYIHYCVRCLDSNEFNNKEKYNPIFNSLNIVL